MLPRPPCWISGGHFAAGERRERNGREEKGREGRREGTAGKEGGKAEWKGASPGVSPDGRPVEAAKNHKIL